MNKIQVKFLEVKLIFFNHLEDFGFHSLFFPLLYFCWYLRNILLMLALISLLHVPYRFYFHFLVVRSTYLSVSK